METNYFEKKVFSIHTKILIYVYYTIIIHTKKTTIFTPSNLGILKHNVVRIYSFRLFLFTKRLKAIKPNIFVFNFKITHK